MVEYGNITVSATDGAGTNVIGLLPEDSFLTHVHVALAGGTAPVLVRVFVRVSGRSYTLIRDWCRASSFSGSIGTVSWEGRLFLEKGTQIDVGVRNDTGATVSVGCDYVTLRGSEMP